MPITKARAPRRAGRRPAGPSADKRRRFLAELALSANVTASADKAKLAPTNFYRLRARDAAFRAAWHAALCEGYARLETEMLAEALAEPDPDVSEAVLKARLHRQKLALALLAAHRASVRGERGAMVPNLVFETKGAKARLISTIAAMRDRAAAQPLPTAANDRDAP
jgi:hypothetical protein